MLLLALVLVLVLVLVPGRPILRFNGASRLVHGGPILRFSPTIVAVGRPQRGDAHREGSHLELTPEVTLWRAREVEPGLALGPGSGVGTHVDGAPLEEELGERSGTTGVAEDLAGPFT